MRDGTLEYGSMGERDAPDVYDLLAQSFAAPLDEVPRWLERAGRDQVRVVRRGDEPVAACLLVPMGQWLGGRSVGMVGIAGVGTRPDQRGQGAARFLMESVVRELHAAGVPISTLYPAIDVLYRRVGYERAGCTWKLEVALDVLPAAPVEGMHVERLLPADEPLAESAYREWATRRPGTLARGPYIWSRVRQPTGGTVSSYLVRGPTGVEGVIRLALSKPVPDRRFEIRLTDFVALTPAAGRALWRFLAGYSSTGQLARWYGSPTDPVLAILDEQRVEAALSLKWMLRVIDVPRALEERGYPAGLAGELHLEVKDDVLAPNAGRWVLKVAEGRGRVEAGGRGEVGLDVRALASLYTGFSTPDWLLAAGLVEGPPAALELAGLLFGGPLPFMADFF